MNNNIAGAIVNERFSLCKDKCMLQLFSVLLFLILIREVLAFPKSWCRAQASNSVWNSLEKFMDYGKRSQDKSSSTKNKSCAEKELWRYLNKDLWQPKAGVIFGESIGLKPDFWLHDLKQQNLQLDRVSRQALQGRLSEVWINSLLCYMVFMMKVPLLWPEVTLFPADHGFLGHAWCI